MVRWMVALIIALAAMIVVYVVAVHDNTIVPLPPGAPAATVTVSGADGR